ncbi:hypothetical protein [Pyxidicoccus xibeiensis]|uniref:hypothetical protein n=1 Tax=Pyxidicoccus xibeiensis TaxID=2906759 RepID=UPI0020A74A84|nr:hypothetical protein [Pyxidicoccus xibeiensis]MCP3142401.1 hypothetical protein [Pyxidicoccus xibeiensis]
MKNVDELKAVLIEMPASEKVRSYLSYAHELTIVARESYDGSSPQLAWVCNEALHRLMGHLIRLHSGVTDPESEQSFARMIVETAESRGWLAMLRRSLVTRG